MRNHSCVTNLSPRFLWSIDQLVRNEANFSGTFQWDTTTFCASTRLTPTEQKKVSTGLILEWAHVHGAEGIGGREMTANLDQKEGMEKCRQGQSKRQKDHTSEWEQTVYISLALWAKDHSQVSNRQQVLDKCCLLKYNSSWSTLARKRCILNHGSGSVFSYSSTNMQVSQ